MNLNYEFFTIVENFSEKVNNGNIKSIVLQYIKEDRTSELTNLDTSKVTDMSGLFDYESYSLPADNELTTKFKNFNVPLSWNTTNVTNMSGMFKNAKSFNTNINHNHSNNNWNTSNVTDMSSMFENATNFNNGETNSNSNVFFKLLTENVIKMNSMFKNATTFDIGISLSRYNTNGIQYIYWDTRNLEDMSFMFENTSNITFNNIFLYTTNVKKIEGIFNEIDFEDN